MGGKLELKTGKKMHKNTNSIENQLQHSLQPLRMGL